jgi:hypothetical protein
LRIWIASKISKKESGISAAVVGGMKWVCWESVELTPENPQPGLKMKQVPGPFKIMVGSAMYNLWKHLKDLQGSQTSLSGIPRRFQRLSLGNQRLCLASSFQVDR